MTETIVIKPHHPDCRGKAHPGWWAGQGLDPERCCYCAALARRAGAGLGRDEGDLLDYRYGGPRCACTTEGVSA